MRNISKHFDGDTADHIKSELLKYQLTWYGTLISLIILAVIEIIEIFMNLLKGRGKDYFGPQNILELSILISIAFFQYL